MKARRNDKCEVSHGMLMNKALSWLTIDYKQLGLILMFVLITPQSYANDALLREARDILTRGEFKQAYELLESQMLEQAGNSDYDYLLGVSALEAAKPGQAIFALERVVASSPGNGGARFALGRAFFAVKQYERARSEFNKVLSLNPASKIANSSQEFLNKISSYTRQWRVRAALGVNLGDDKNANSATGIKIHDGFPLSDTSLKTPSSMFGYQTSLGLDYKLTPRIAWSIDGVTIQKKYASASFVNQSIGHLASEIKHTRGSVSVGTSVSHQTIKVDEQFNNMKLGLNSFALLKHKKHQIKAAVATGFSRFEDNSNSRDVNQYIGQLSHTIVYPAKSAILLMTNTHAGHDFPLIKRSAYERNLAGISHTGLIGANKPAAIKYNLSIQYSDYKNGTLTGDLTRKNRNEWTKQFSLGAVIRPASRWQIMPQIQMIKRQSTISLYSFAKTNMTLGIKRSL